MKVIATILGILFLAVLFFGIPIIAQMKACHDCQKKKECEAALEKGGFPPCRKDLPCKFNQNMI